MKTRPPSHHRTCRRVRRTARAFTLIELLLVVTVMAILLTLASVSVSHVVAGQQLSSSTMRFTNDLAYAAQLASRENRLIGVRFLKLPEASDPESAQQYRAWQFLAPDRTTGKWRPLDEPHRLDASTIMMEHDIYSTMVHVTPLATAADVDDKDTTPPLFAFKPEGGTTLPKVTTAPKWCVTLALAADLERTPGILPANFRTLVLNAHTGAIIEY
ncbi:MAG: Verru_Chthon cassette protein D [Roseimicrobium sp.]